MGLVNNDIYSTISAWIIKSYKLLLRHLGESLLKGAQEALSYAKGHKKELKLIVYIYPNKLMYVQFEIN